MTDEQKAAYVNGQVFCANAEMQGMIAANKEREDQGKALAYGQDAFDALANNYGLHHNALIGFFHSH